MLDHAARLLRIYKSGGSAVYKGRSKNPLVNSSTRGLAVIPLVNQLQKYVYNGVRSYSACKFNNHLVDSSFTRCYKGEMESLLQIVEWVHKGLGSVAL